MTAAGAGASGANEGGFVAACAPARAVQPSEGQNRPELTSVTSATVQDESPVESWQGARRADLGETGLAFLGLVTRTQAPF